MAINTPTTFLMLLFLLVVVAPLHSTAAPTRRSPAFRALSATSRHRYRGTRLLQDAHDDYVTVADLGGSGYVGRVPEIGFGGGDSWLPETGGLEDFDGGVGLELLQDVEEEASFEITAGGPGQVSGLSWTISPHTIANVTVDIAIPAMTSQQVKNLRDSWAALLSASKQEELREFEKNDTSASANLSFLGFFGGGGKVETSKTKTRENMESLGLSKEDISNMTQTLSDIAKQMSNVQANFLVNNDHIYSVSGNMIFFVLSGNVTLANGEHSSFTMLSDGGVAGKAPLQANAEGEIKNIGL